MKRDLNEVYRAEGWGKITDLALRIDPMNVESQAREVARWADTEITSLRTQLAETERERDVYLDNWKEARQYLAIETKHAEDAEASRDTLADQLNKAVEVVRWYSDDANWTHSDEAPPAALYDRGLRARAFIQKHEASKP